MEVPKGEYDNGLQDWIKHWRTCMTTRGDYFERDK